MGDIGYQVRLSAFIVHALLHSLFQIVADPVNVAGDFRIYPFQVLCRQFICKIILGDLPHTIQHLLSCGDLFQDMSARVQIQEHQDHTAHGPCMTQQITDDRIGNKPGQCQRRPLSAPDTCFIIFNDLVNNAPSAKGPGLPSAEDAQNSCQQKRIDEKKQDNICSSLWRRQDFLQAVPDDPCSKVQKQSHGNQQKFNGDLIKIPADPFSLSGSFYGQHTEDHQGNEKRGSE